jgi:hypothetical protein
MGNNAKFSTLDELDPVNAYAHPDTSTKSMEISERRPSSKPTKASASLGSSFGWQRAAE